MNTSLISLSQRFVRFLLLDAIPIVGTAAAILGACFLLICDIR